MFNNWKMREKMLDKDLDALPSRNFFPQLKNNYADLGERINWGELACELFRRFGIGVLVVCAGRRLIWRFLLSSRE